MRTVLLHGWSFNSLIWPLAIRAGSSTVPTDISSVAAPNLYSYEKPLTFANIARQLFAELKQSEDEIILLGWSMGGSIALELLSQYPDLLVTKLVLVSSTAKFVNSADYACGVTPAVARQLRQRIVKDMDQGLAFFHDLLGSSSDITTFDLPEESIIRDKARLLETLDELYSADYRQKLADIKVPTVIIHGAEDLICPLAGAQFLAEHLPNAELEVFNNSGHNMKLATNILQELIGQI